jgi:hypothetical protein
MQIVVAERDGGRLAQGLDPAQRAERIGAAIDEVTDEPEVILVRRKTQGIEQLAEFAIAPLDVPDRVESH